MSGIGAAPSPTRSSPDSYVPISLPSPRCRSMLEHPSAASERAKLSSPTNASPPSTPLEIHLSYGLAYTVGSALGSTPPTIEQCLEAFTVPNKAGLTAGARAWSKHGHRSMPQLPEPQRVGEQPLELQRDLDRAMDRSKGWWGIPSGPVAKINEAALELFWKVMRSATWKNLHWLPHGVLIYEARVEEGYGMRWAKDESPPPFTSSPSPCEEGEHGGKQEWTLRGFVEPMMDHGHEVGWRH